MVTLATVAAERLGSKMGGLVGGLPTMVATSLFFIGYAQTPQTASEATSTIPLIMGFNGIFLVIYVILARKGAWVGMSGALVLWLVLAWAVLFLRIDSFPTSLLIFILSLIGAYHLLENRFRLPSTGRLSIRYTPFQIISRALFSGSVVSAAVYLSKVGGPIWRGVVAPFSDRIHINLDHHGQIQGCGVLPGDRQVSAGQRNDQRGCLRQRGSLFLPPVQPGSWHPPVWDLLVYEEQNEMTSEIRNSQCGRRNGIKEQSGSLCSNDLPVP
jgi:hypothetical protein